jgi:hypothetical protein
MERFWNKVDKSNGCWVWTGGKSNKGYGRFKVKGSLVSSHRFSWELKHGKIPEGLLICHHCDNPSCVRPDHLFLGTYSDNKIDADKKGRSKHIGPRGEKAGASKLTTEQVLKIRKLYQSGNLTLTKLGDKFGVAHNTIGDIIRRRTWKHI